MKLISWNVNGLRACMTKGFADFMTAECERAAGLYDQRLCGFYDGVGRGYLLRAGDQDATGTGDL